MYVCMHVCMYVHGHKNHFLVYLLFKEFIVFVFQLIFNNTQNDDGFIVLAF